MRMRSTPAAAFSIMAALAVSCTTDPTPAADAPVTTRAAPVTDAAPATEAAPVSVTTTTTAEPDTTLRSTTAAETTTTTDEQTTTAPPAKTAVPTTIDSEFIESRLVGRSVEGRSIMAERRGTKGGRAVLVIGVIHGDENDGLAIMEHLHRMDVPDGVDLWLVDSMNPDGVANDDRHNANDVDLNRNFPLNWGPIGQPGDGQYAGPSAASEPETKAMVEFITEIRPDLTLWYHQDLYRISPGRGRDGVIRERYAELTGLPVVSITGGTYTGVAATWARDIVDPGVAFIVELGSSLTDAEALLHAEAVLTVAREDN
jgi:murein peptide amidase A